MDGGRLVDPVECERAREQTRQSSAEVIEIFLESDQVQGSQPPPEHDLVQAPAAAAERSLGGEKPGRQQETRHEVVGLGQQLRIRQEVGERK
jgi:hypothetical protein